MTNKEAIYIINNRLNTYYCTDEDLLALDLAIKALDERPQGEYTEEDMKQAIKENFDIGYEMAKNKYERPQGEWIKNEHTFWTCSHCNWFNEMNRIKYNFCPCCGADMRKEDKK